VDWEVAVWGAFEENDISPIEMGRMNYLRDQQNALLQPAEMIRRAPPYEEIPFPYGMYRQPVPHASTPKRFGVDVFKNGVQDSQLIPIDLPGGPDYAVEPIDGLAIDLSGGVAGKLCRRVDSDGQISLPELGPVLSSGKRLSDVHKVVSQPGRGTRATGRPEGDLCERCGPSCDWNGG
jgi:hypothetical protein